jgi:regulator of protease activity HflC (stomatin/prohibitin superfamily)
MIKRLGTVLLVALTLLTPSATPPAAQTLDPAAAEALATTLRMLADPTARAQVLASDPAAAAIDRQVQGMAGSSQLVQEVYGLAAEVFADLARSTGGDTRQLNEALERAKSDPASFAAMLRPETLERLRALATRISDAQR